MRNLKKFLALVLAMVMAFSLMLTASAANEQDNGTHQYGDETVSDTFKEAVDVLYGMGIMTGDNGNFYGDRDVMRSEMAAVIYRLVTGDTKQLKSPLYASIAAERFSDVKESDWFAPYIGFCYDLGLVKGHDGKYNPWGNVNGYETLIMALRAIGYGKNGEYEGAYWYINASSDGTLYGLLRDVDKTHYANTLSANTKREVVASIIFQAAQKPQVVYRLGNYDPYVGVPVGTGNNKLNPSLGQKNFGLTYNYGVVVGNQSTGETVTKVSFPLDVVITGGNLVAAAIADTIKDNCYSYANTAAGTDGNVTLSMQWTTDLRFFGHAVKVWYDYRSTNGTVSTVTAGTGSVSFQDNLKTYALYNRATKAEVVKATADTDLTAANTTPNAGKLGAEVLKAGFTKNATTDAFFNYSFGPNTAARATSNATYASPIKENNTATAAPYYVVISNSANNQVDLVISLDMTVTQISQSNSVQTPNFVSVNSGNVTPYFGIAGDRLAITDAYGQAKGNRTNIIQSSLGAASTTELGANVAAIEITGTTGVVNGTANAGNFANTTAAPLSSTYYHELFKLDRTVTKTVIAHNPVTEELTFSDGTTMERSWLADTVSDNRILDLDTTAANNSTKNVARAHAPGVYGTYTFTLDEDDNYIFWSTEGSGQTFIYGTYLDYQQPVATSTFTYPLVGVIDGEMVTRNITTGTENVATGTAGSYHDAMNAASYSASSLPKRDANGVVGADVKDGKYMGFYISDAGALTPVVGAGSTWKQGTATYFGTTAVAISKSDVNIGAKLVGKEANNTGLYLNQNTVFHIVSGAGTDSQKVETVTGLSGLMGDSASVTIHGEKLVSAVPSTTASKYWPLLNTTKNSDMIYYTQDKFDYAQDYTTTAFAVTEVYIPAEAITRTGNTVNTLYFVGNNTPGIWNNTGEKATLFTVYDLTGEAHNLWIQGWAHKTPGATTPGGTADAAFASAAAMIADDTTAKDNFFVNLVDTGKKTNGDQTVYTVAAVSSTANDNDLGIVGRYVQTVNTGAAFTMSDANDDSTTAQNYDYIASTFSQYIASIGVNRADLWNVEGAKVVNLNTAKWPGVTDVITLNQASSIKDVVGANQGIPVSAVRNADNAQKLDVIFVDAAATP